MKLTVKTLLFTALLSIGFLNLSSAQVISSGEWVGKNYQVEGKYFIMKSESGYKLILSSDFSTNRGPDLKIFLSELPPEKVNDFNADEGFKLSELQSNRGSQEYLFPPNFNPADYSTIMIHCEKFSKLWGIAKVEVRG